MFKDISKEPNSQNHENQELRPTQPVISRHFLKPSEGKVGITTNRNINIPENQDALHAHAPSFSNTYLSKINAITAMKDARESQTSEKSESSENESPCQKQEETSEGFTEPSSVSSEEPCSNSELPPKDIIDMKVKNWLRKNAKWEREQAEKSEKREKRKSKIFKFSK
jgi:hypothetical protein